MKLNIQKINKKIFFYKKIIKKKGRENALIITIIIL